MKKTYYQIVINDQPQRLYIDSSTEKKCTVPAGTGLDGPDEFTSAANAENKATRWGLIDYEIKPVLRDIGTPTNLREIGF